MSRREEPINAAFALALRPLSGTAGHLRRVLPFCTLHGGRRTNVTELPMGLVALAWLHVEPSEQPVEASRRPPEAPRSRPSVPVSMAHADAAPRAAALTDNKPVPAEATSQQSVGETNGTRELSKPRQAVSPEVAPRLPDRVGTATVVPATPEHLVTKFGEAAAVLAAEDALAAPSRGLSESNWIGGAGPLGASRVVVAPNAATSTPLPALPHRCNVVKQVVEREVAEQLEALPTPAIANAPAALAEPRAVRNANRPQVSSSAPRASVSSETCAVSPATRETLKSIRTLLIDEQIRSGRVRR